MSTCPTENSGCAIKVWRRKIVTGSAKLFWPGVYGRRKGAGKAKRRCLDLRHITFKDQLDRLIRLYECSVGARIIVLVLAAPPAP